MEQYRALKKRLMTGWRTWNVRSVLSHVRMDDGLALNVCIKEPRSFAYLKETLIGRQEGAGCEVAFPGLHAYDDSYTEMRVRFREMEFSVESTVEEGEILLLVTPLTELMRPATVVLETGFLWNRPGAICAQGSALRANSPFGETTISATGQCAENDPNIPTQTPYLARALDGPVAFMSGRARTVAEIRALLDARREALRAGFAALGELGPIYEAVQCAVAWDTTYDARKDRVASPISRIWSINWGGFVLACWDNYFASFMASLGDRDLAYANVIEITSEQTGRGFIPNIVSGMGFSSEDRSQPPVGSAMLVEIYRKYREKWLVEMLFPKLMVWNTWFYEHRRSPYGALCWGSDPYPGKCGAFWETAGVDDTYGGALESGLDNSPMYDDVPFDKERHIMKQEDVGLTGLYILDCVSLGRLARLLGREEEAALLAKRQAETEEALEQLWDEENGLYYNRRTDTMAFSRRISPTNFYALFSTRVPAGRARRMADEHYYNEREFYGKWMMPSIARDDPAYPDQDYWRGRVWPPMNMLAYMAMRGHDIPDARRDLAEHSSALLRKEWTEHRHIHENYNADTGEGCDVKNSDKFYHWGALLGIIDLIERGKVAGFLSELESETGGD